MGIIVDLIIVATILLFILLGYKKGLTGSLIKLASFAIALVLAFMLYKPVASMVMENTQIDENIQSKIIDTFGVEVEQKENNESKMPTTMLEDINNNIENATAEARNEIVETTAKETSITIIYFGSGLAIFIITRFVLFIISLFAKGITSLPILKQVDKAGGIIYGAVEGLVIIFILLSIISLMSVVWIDNPVILAIDKSSIGNMLYNNNIILKFLL